LGAKIGIVYELKGLNPRIPKAFGIGRELYKMWKLNMCCNEKFLQEK